jgi:hypothetical protein
MSFIGAVHSSVISAKPGIKPPKRAVSWESLSSLEKVQCP